jgi:5-formyltetrahydrofolate cyclo-ligase
LACITTTEQKHLLRLRLSETEAAWSPEQRRRSDEALLSRFLALPQVQKSAGILLFYGMGAEPDTRKLLPALRKQGKAVALPRCLPERRMEFRLYQGEERMVRHSYGMLEPSDNCPLMRPGKAQLALIPAVCYDQSCLRLGRGGGYYDRFLAEYDGYTVGLCREAFLQSACPEEAHDRRVDLVLTEERIFCRR